MKKTKCDEGLVKELDVIELLTDAFMNLHKFTESAMRKVRQIEDDEKTPDGHRTTLMALRWDWETRENKEK